MVAIDTTARELTPDLLDLMEHEKVIEQGLGSFIDVGCALIAIKANRKYVHGGYATFDDYCEQRWGIKHARRAQLMMAASVATELLESSTTVELPAPQSERQVRPLALVLPADRPAVWAEAVEDADGGQPTAAQVEKAAVKRQPPKREHPATFSDPILDKIAEHVAGADVVLDPFAGTGRVHELRSRGVDKTIGIELEAEWADKHPDTLHGDAIELMGEMESSSVDAIATSPTYGNRMADHHNATDESVRLTYKHTLGRDLTDGNSGGMQWGPEYRAFHEDAWAEAVRTLKPGGTFTLNIKNHIRDGEIQRVAEWHINTLMLEHQLELVALDIIPTRGLAAGANTDLRTGFEIVATFRKAVDE